MTLINSSLVQGESVFERRMALRTAARKAFLMADGEARVRKAMEHRTRPERGPFHEGQLVFFWRRNRFENKHHWHGPGVVIGKSGNSKVWIAKGTKVYRCCPEQLRTLSPDQEAAVRLLPADMVYVRDNVSARGAGNYHDLSALERPPDDPADEPVESSPVQGEEDWRQAAGVGSLADEDTTSVIDHGSDAPQGEVRAPEGSPGDESPSKRARTQGEPSVLSQMMRANLELLDSGRPASSGTRMEVDASTIPVPESDEPDEGLEVMMTDGDHWIVDHGRRKLVRVHVVDRDGLFAPVPKSLPVLDKDVEDKCTVVGFDRHGTKRVCQYDHRVAEGRSLFSHGVLWTGRTEFVLKEGWSVSVILSSIDKKVWTRLS